MITPNQFNPVDTAAMMTKNPPVKKIIDPKQLAAMPDLLKKRPIIPAPKKPKSNQGNGNFPANDDPYWKLHPLQTVHSDGTVRNWGQDTTNIARQKNPNTLPKQMLPPPSTPQGKPQKDLSDKAKGYSDYYYRKNY